MELLDALNWRYATKKMNGQTVPQDKVEKILEAAHLAPTSSGLQPFEVIVVTNPELKEKIQAIAYNQSQVTDSSHLLIFAAWDKYTDVRINSIFDHLNAERGLPDSSTADYRTRLIDLYTNQTSQQNFEHAARQAYIAFGTAIAAAAELKVDATPMEGFDSSALDSLLNLSEKGLKSVTLLPLGYRDESNDWLVNLKKVRKRREEFITELN
ncbi:nitroreductase family protein [Albibacterium bauzanense]|uniref:Nitroreductase n=1 Tax=Albibacterium bauzanense TaxID=653929 RepID=A0A4R1M435_9SPHI|nr:nitroreductase family protein [Albibacterium bauzanense]TCK85860.1 nitroreductase [Albibacterium bauzanense]